MRRIPHTYVALPIVAAALVAMGIAGAVIRTAVVPMVAERDDEDPCPPGEHERLQQQLDEFEDVADAMLATSARFVSLAASYRNELGMVMALNGERPFGR